MGLRVDGRSARLMKFEPIFVDSQSSDFCIKGWPWKPQFGCRTTWPGDTAAAFCQCGLNHFLFLPLQRTIKCNHWTGDLVRFLFEPGIVDRKSITVAQDDGPLNYIL